MVNYLEDAEVELHGNVQCLIVESHQLTTSVPEVLRIIVETVNPGKYFISNNRSNQNYFTPGSLGIYSRHLQFVVLDEANRI